MRHKDFKLLLFIPLLLFLVVSCSDFLTEEPTTFVNPDTFLEDARSAETFLVGAYDAVQSIISSGSNSQSGMRIHWGTVAADEVVVPGWEGDRKLMYLQQVTPGNVTVGSLWKGLYQGVNVTNSVVDRIGDMTADQIEDEDKNRMIAEARFLRAALYFDLVTAWENVPLVKNEVVSLDNLDVPQASTEEVYAFIIEDLLFAEANLTAEQGGGRATKGAAQALLGKVYLQMTGFPLDQNDKFALAAEKLEAVINSGVYDLLPVYAHVFDLDHEQSVEMVYSIGMDGPGLGEGGLLSTFYGPNGNVNNGGGWGTCFINHEFEASYDREDVRLAQNIAKHNANDEVRIDRQPQVSWRGWKHHAEKPNNYPNDTPFDNPYIRYADVLLLYAEAKLGQGQLTQEILNQTVNRVRARARGDNGSVPDLILGSDMEMADAILDERRKELCLEGWRRNDLIRFGKYKETLMAINQGGWSTAGNPGPNYDDYEIRWPIPEAELVLNRSLVQNPGY